MTEEELELFRALAQSHADLEKRVMLLESILVFGSGPRGARSFEDRFAGYLQLVQDEPEAK